MSSSSAWLLFSGLFSGARTFQSYIILSQFLVAVLPLRRSHLSTFPDIVSMIPLNSLANQFGISPYDQQYSISILIYRLFIGKE